MLERGSVASSAPKGVKKVFFKNVTFDTTAGYLMKKFKACGKVESLDLWTRFDGSSKGKGTVDFSTPEEAEEAVRTLMDVDIDGRPIWVELEDPERAEAREQKGLAKGKGKSKGKGKGKAFSKKGGGSVDGESCKIFFKKVPTETPEDFLQGLFQEHGDVKEFELWKYADGRSKGLGTVEFGSPEEAQAVAEALDGAEVDGKIIKVEVEDPNRAAGGSSAKGGKAIAPKGGGKGKGGGGPCRLFFRNVLFETTPGFLRGIFKKYGNVVHVDLWQRPDGRSKGCGVVEFSKHSEASAALAGLESHEVDGRPLMLEWEDAERAKGGSKGDAGKGGKDSGKGGATTVFFKNVLFETPAKFLLDLFRKFGFVKEFDLWQGPEGRSRGCGTVVYKLPAQAQAAIDNLNGAEVDGRVINVEYEASGKGGGKGAKGAGSAQASSNPCRLFFKNTLFETPSDFLNGLFRKFGYVVSFEMNVGPDGRTKGCGAVQYRTPAEARAALAGLDGAEVDGRKLVVEYEDPGKASEVKGKGKGAVEAGKGKGAPAGKASGKGGIRRCFFHNVLYETTPGYLMGRFKQFGTVVALDLWKGPDGRSRGMGTVEYAHPAEARAAAEGLNWTDVDGRPMGVDLEDPSKSADAGALAVYAPMKGKGKSKDKGKGKGKAVRSSPY